MQPRVDKRTRRQPTNRGGCVCPKPSLHHIFTRASDVRHRFAVSYRTRCALALSLVQSCLHIRAPAQHRRRLSPFIFMSARPSELELRRRTRAAANVTRSSILQIEHRSFVRLDLNCEGRRLADRDVRCIGTCHLDNCTCLASASLL